MAKADAEMGYSAKAGDMLVGLDDMLARMELREEELNLEAAEANLINSKRRLDEAVNLGDANFPRSERENRETAYRMALIAVSRLRPWSQLRKRSSSAIGSSLPSMGW